MCGFVGLGFLAGVSFWIIESARFRTTLDFQRIAAFEKLSFLAIKWLTMLSGFSIGYGCLQSLLQSQNDKCEIYFLEKQFSRIFDCFQLFWHLFTLVLHHSMNAVVHCCNQLVHICMEMQNWKFFVPSVTVFYRMGFVISFFLRICCQALAMALEVHICSEFDKENPFQLGYLFLLNACQKHSLVLIVFICKRHNAVFFQKICVPV